MIYALLAAAALTSPLPSIRYTVLNERGSLRLIADTMRSCVKENPRASNYQVVVCGRNRVRKMGVRAQIYAQPPKGPMIVPPKGVLVLIPRS